MKISRSHTGMIALVSIFTGIIAPVVANSTRSYPFPLTDMQWGAYIVLFLLIPSFYFASIGRWKIYGLIGMILMLIIGYLLAISINNGVHDASGDVIPYLSWGWYFFAIGSGFLIYAILGKNKKEEKIILFVDHVIGIVGSGTLICLTGLIILMSYIPHKDRQNVNVLRDFFGSGQVIYQSGILLSPAFDSIRDLTYNRKSGDIAFIAGSGTLTYIFPGGQPTTDSGVSLVSIGKNIGIVSSSGTIRINGVQEAGDVILPQSIQGGILIQTMTGVTFITDHGSTFFPGKHQGIRHPIGYSDPLNLVWMETISGGTTVVKKNNMTFGMEELSIESVAISENGTEVMILAIDKNGNHEISRNGVRTEQVLSGYISGSFQSNGSHSIYAIRNQNGGYKIVFDGTLLQNTYEEIREIFLENNGGSYAFFARPIGEEHYCLFTKYRGNLCGIDGYMNPRLSADGVSILYAALKKDVWSIYRNTDIVIRDTGYHGIHIANDYVFFDITNPKQFLFIEKTNTGEYVYRKNGKIIPGTWKDISLDVWFGYDNKIITAAQDGVGWRIIEM